jgi:2-polyprenyl-6-methoxyphenol hydroxylase-like FAD-dependent oxidoreductase
MAGVVAPFLAATNRVTSVAVVTRQRELARMPFVPEESPYPYIAMVPQNITEQLLCNELRRKGGEVEYNTRLEAVEQNPDQVIATVNCQGKTSVVRAAFVVGCDGAHSKVRQALGLTLDGGEYPESFMLADIETNEALPANELQLCPSEFGPAAIFPMSATRRRLVATVERQEGDAPSLSLVRAILLQRAPAGLEAKVLHWSSYFRIHHRHASELRSGRVFIAGDAAHIHSPFGGQGMNTGLHDVWNLVWKLDLFLKGHGTNQLLDSYTAERVPVIRSVIETTDLLTKVMGTASRLAQVLRNAVIPMVSQLAPFQHAFVQRLSELGIAYEGSPIVEGPGIRYLDDSMRGGAGIRSQFLMMLENGAPGAGKVDRSFHDAVEIRASKKPGVTLVRPDGYVAYASAHAASPHALDVVESLLRKQAS